MAASDVGLNSSRLFHVQDRLSGRHFLVDTGAEVSIIPPSLSDCTSHRHSPFSLQAINNTNISTYGVRSLTLDLGLRRIFCWTFVVADVQKPILGADFLSKFGLLVDVWNCRLSDATTNLKVQGVLTNTHSADPDDPYLSLLAEFPDVTHQ